MVRKSVSSGLKKASQQLTINCIKVLKPTKSLVCSESPSEKHLPLGDLYQVSLDSAKSAAKWQVSACSILIDELCHAYTATINSICCATSTETVGTPFTRASRQREGYVQTVQTPPRHFHPSRISTLLFTTLSSTWTR